MRCSKAGKLIPRYVDSELDQSAAQELEGHLQTCPRCRAEEARLRSCLALLAQWAPVETRLGYDALLDRIQQRAAIGSKRNTAPAFGVPSWAAAGLAAISIAGGVMFGMQAPDAQPRTVPTEQVVSSSIGLQSFDDIVEASMIYGAGAPDTKGESR